MAKRKQQKDQLPHTGVRRVPIKPLLPSTRDIRDLPMEYANHAQFAINPNGIFMDLYQLGPIPSDASKVEIILTHRIVIPLELGKGFATGLANLIAGYEKEMGVTVPMVRTADPDDPIRIWEEQSDDDHSE